MSSISLGTTLEYGLEKADLDNHTVFDMELYLV